MKLVIQIAAGIIVAWSIITIITAMVKTIADNRKLKQ
jgi:hypothetical protein